MRNVRALVLGPHETPYQFGFFEVSIPARVSYVYYAKLGLLQFAIRFNDGES